MHSVKFDNVELVDVIYHLRYARHHSAPDRDVTLLDLASEDGAALVAEKYAVKSIVVSGFISASSSAVLQTRVDSFKELFSRKEKNLDITPDGGTIRRYKATCVRHTLEGDFYNLTFLPYEAEFVVPSGVSQDTALTAALEAVAVTTVSYSSTFSLSGSARQKPIITITLVDTFTNAKGIEFKLTNGSEEKIIVTNNVTWTAGDVLVVNTETKSVTYNGTEVGFYRTMPSFLLGTNNFTINVGDIIDESFEITTGTEAGPIYAANWRAQSFSVSHTDGTYKGIEVYIYKLNNPPNALTIEIQTDSSGVPSGVAVTNATFSIAAASVGTSKAWVKANSANLFDLSANTKYWIVLKTTAGDGTNHYNWHIEAGTAATYKKGNISSSVDSGANWIADTNRDHTFKILFGGASDGDGNDDYTLDVDYHKRYL